MCRGSGVADDAVHVENNRAQHRHPIKDRRRSGKLVVIASTPQAIMRFISFFVFAVQGTTARSALCAAATPRDVTQVFFGKMAWAPMAFACATRPSSVSSENKKPDRQRLVRGAHFLKRHRIEGDHTDPLGKFFALQKRHHGVGQGPPAPADGFQLDDQPQGVLAGRFPVPEPLEDIDERRNILPRVIRAVPGSGVKALNPLQGKVPDKTASIGGAVHGGVVHDDHLAIGGQLHVHFNEVAAAPDGFFKGEERIFGSQPHRAAVPDDEARRLVRPKI